MCEGMDWELIEAEEDHEAQPIQEGQYGESMKYLVPNHNIINDITRANISSTPYYVMQAATYNKSNTASAMQPNIDVHDFHEIVPLDLLKVGGCNSSTNSMLYSNMEPANSCLVFNSMQKSSQKHMESPYNLCLASNNDYDAPAILLKQANFADDLIIVNDANCSNRIGSDYHDRMKSSSKCSDAKSSEDIAELGTYNCRVIRSSDHHQVRRGRRRCTADHQLGVGTADDHNSNSELSRKEEGYADFVCFQDQNKSNSEEVEVQKRKSKGELAASASVDQQVTIKLGAATSDNNSTIMLQQQDVLNEPAAPAPAHAHIFTERERRKKMKCLYDTLQSLLGLSITRADKATILEATISKIQMLENAKTLLLSQKAAKCRPLNPTDHDDLNSENNNKKEVHQGFLQLNDFNDSIGDETLVDQENFDQSCFHVRDPFGNVELHVSGSMGLFTISLRKAVSSSFHLPSIIFTLLLNNNLEVLSAHISSSNDIIHYSLYTKGSSCKTKSFWLAYHELLCQLPT